MPPILLLLALLAWPLSGHALEVGDPNIFAINVESDGTFGEIILDNVSIDSGLPQTQFANGQYFHSGGDVTILSPTTASYTAYIGDDADPDAEVFQIDVLSVLRGPLPLVAVPNIVFEQYLTFTNLTDIPRPLESVAFYQSYLNDTAEDDVVQQDVPRAIVYGTDAPSGQLVAMTARPVNQSPLQWDVAVLTGILDSDPVRTSDLQNRTGPIAANGDPVEMAIGVDAGSILPDDQTTLLYYYLFSTNMQAPPASFPVPLPGTLALFGLGLAGLFGLRQRRPVT